MKNPENTIKIEYSVFHSKYSDNSCYIVTSDRDFTDNRQDFFNQKISEKKLDFVGHFECIGIPDSWKERDGFFYVHRLLVKLHDLVKDRNEYCK